LKKIRDNVLKFVSVKVATKLLYYMLITCSGIRLDVECKMWSMLMLLMLKNKATILVCPLAGLTKLPTTLAKL